jgi:hypothetical protein
MFFATYLWRELSGRMRQAIVIALGLAVGAGLVVSYPPCRSVAGALRPADALARVV